MKYIKVCFFILFQMPWILCYGKNITIKIRTKTEVKGLDTDKYVKVCSVEQGELNLFFISKSSGVNLSIPDSLMSNSRKSETVIKGDSSEVRGGDEAYEMYVYDKEGKLTSYFYSSCIRCGIPFKKIEITYNSKNKVIQVFDLGFRNQKIFIKYSVFGKLKKLSVYNEDELYAKIRIKYPPAGCQMINKE